MRMLGRVLSKGGNVATATATPLPFHKEPHESLRHLRKGIVLSMVEEGGGWMLVLVGNLEDGSPFVDARSRVTRHLPTLPTCSAMPILHLYFAFMFAFMFIESDKHSEFYEEGRY